MITMTREDGMDVRLEQFMKKYLGVSLSDIKKMNEAELDALYDKACDLEIEMAMKADETTESGETQESIDAAHVVDYLYNL